MYRYPGQAIQEQSRDPGHDQPGAGLPKRWHHRVWEDTQNQQVHTTSVYVSITVAYTVITTLCVERLAQCHVSGYVTPKQLLLDNCPSWPTWHVMCECILSLASLLSVSVSLQTHHHGRPVYKRTHRGIVTQHPYTGVDQTDTAIHSSSHHIYCSGNTTVCVCTAHSNCDHAYINQPILEF